MTATAGTMGRLPLAALVTAAAVGAANVYNDVVDTEVDAVNRPERPLPAGVLTMRAARVMAGILTVTACIAAAGLGLELMAWATASLAVGLAYSDRLQRVPVVGNVVVALLFANAVLFGAAAAGAVTFASAFAAAEVMSFTLGREILKGVPDVEGDRAARHRTIASEWGAAVAVDLFCLFAALTAVVAAVAVAIGHACPVHLLAVLATVTVPAALIRRTLSRDPSPDRTRSMLERTVWIWVFGSLSLLLLRWCPSVPLLGR
ncbi:MAG: geranylgeranylglycerol-phosphate geranylgeranyltransferase [Actinomycetota bacterium]|nr:geranylgeranylglycerol-phosphate geranylgeranyltransferase [Actinomycetota bacterium]